MATVLEVDDLVRAENILCKGCGNVHTQRMADEFSYSTGFKTGYLCLECGLSVEMANVVVPVLPSSEKFLDLEVCKSSTWYHYTEMNSWPELIEFPGLQYEHRNFYAHVGTLKSALDRRMSLGAGEFTNWQGKIFEVRVRTEARWCPDLLEDSGDLHREECSESDWEVLRYLNRYENPGSVSLAVCNTAIEVVGTVPWYLLTS